MMNKTIFSKFHIRTVGVVVALAAIISIGVVSYASHSWGSYHWARTMSSFTLKLGDNVNAAWDSYLATTSTNWSLSEVLDTTIVSGSGGKNCKATSGTVQVCNRTYGNNGWLGIASIWISGTHITQGTVKVNDTYFNTAKYNTPAWRNLVMCQEVGHTFGLDHQDEDFSNSNLGTCMDYTNNPSGPPSNEHPNAHDYDQLQTIYSHLEALTTVDQRVSNSQEKDATDVEDWGKALRKDSHGKTSLYERNLGNGEKLFTFVFWAE